MEEIIRQYLMALHKEFGFFDDEELENSPKRIEKMWAEWKENREFQFTVFDNVENYNQMVILKVPQFYSMCSHHMLPFFGTAIIGYIPQKKICGISKLARLVIKHASRPQLQENMTQQILKDLQESLGTDDVIVVVKARHLCMEMRGVKQTGPEMITSAISGAFHSHKVREEFIRLVE
ncbi:GTP cyclohydrolase I [candidate division KSB1 bacterium]|nr:GTP cyclohydrolase I [candidate division KSB1 bacterium]